MVETAESNNVVVCRELLGSLHLVSCSGAPLAGHAGSPACCHTCPCCRREMLPAYKANRAKPASEFSVDLINLKLLLRFTRIPTLAVPGYEADDVS